MENIAVKQRVIVFTQTPCNPPLGADARRARCLAMALASMHWEVTIYQLKFGPRPIQKNDRIECGVKYHYPSLYAPSTNTEKLSTPLIKFFSLVRFVAELVVLIKCNRFDLAFICQCNLKQIQFLVNILHFSRKPVVKEICEWYPDIPSHREAHGYYSGPLYLKLNGVIAISDYIIKRIHEVTPSNIRSPLPVLKVPILYETETHVAPLADSHRKYFLWCGMIDGYLDLVFFIIRAFSLAVKTKTEEISLKIFGKYNSQSNEKITQLACACGVEEKVNLMGFVDDKVLVNEMHGAEALLLPLFDDGRSKARFPTKLAEYLSTGIPVVATDIGELQQYIKNMDSAILCPPKGETVFADGMRFVLDNPKEAYSIGLRGKIIAQQHFYFLSHARRISDFFDSIIQTCHQQDQAKGFS